MDIEDKELFETALSNEVVEEVAADEPVIEAVAEDGQHRDEQGRFAHKEPEPVAASTPEAKVEGKEEAFVPSWRLREIREEREATERRFAEFQDLSRRQIAELRAQLPKAEPAQAPDVFENPTGAIDFGVKQAVDPIKSQFNDLREYYSKRDAIRDHGREKVDAAYQWVANGMQSRDPEVTAVYQRAMQGMDPFGDIVTAHQQKAVYSQIGNDPNAWFEKQLEERMKDPAFQASILGKTQQSVRTNPSAPNIVRPPSLNRIAAAAGNDDADSDVSDAGLFSYAMK